MAGSRNSSRAKANARSAPGRQANNALMKENEQMLARPDAPPCLPATDVVKAVADYAATNPRKAEVVELLGQPTSAVLLGCGGFGMVMRATGSCLARALGPGRSPHQVLAVKVQPIRLGARELHALLHYTGGGMASLLGYARQDGTDMLVMEAREELLEELSAVLFSMAAIVEDVNVGHGLALLDVAPKNVLVSRSGVGALCAKVTDASVAQRLPKKIDGGFGDAVLVDWGGSDTTIAPEAIISKKAGVKYDLFGQGSIILACLLGGAMLRISLPMVTLGLSIRREFAQHGPRATLATAHTQDILGLHKGISRLMVFGSSLCLAAFPGARPDHNWVREHLLIFACGMHAVENMYGQLPVKQQFIAATLMQFLNCTFEAMLLAHMAQVLHLLTEDEQAALLECFRHVAAQLPVAAHAVRRSMAAQRLPCLDLAGTAILHDPGALAGCLVLGAGQDDELLGSSDESCAMPDLLKGLPYDVQGQHSTEELLRAVEQKLADVEGANARRIIIPPEYADLRASELSQGTLFPCTKFEFMANMWDVIGDNKFNSSALIKIKLDEVVGVLVRLDRAGNLALVQGSSGSSSGGSSSSDSSDEEAQSETTSGGSISTSGSSDADRASEDEGESSSIASSSQVEEESRQWRLAATWRAAVVQAAELATTSSITTTARTSALPFKRRELHSAVQAVLRLLQGCPAEVALAAVLLLDVTGSEDVLAQAAWPGGISSAVRQAKAGAQDNLVMGKLHILFSQDQDQVGDQPQEERGNLAHSLRHDDSMVLLCNLLGLALARAMFGLHSCGLKKLSVEDELLDPMRCAALGVIKQSPRIRGPLVVAALEAALAAGIEAVSRRSSLAAATLAAARGAPRAVAALRGTECHTAALTGLQGRDSRVEARSATRSDSGSLKDLCRRFPGLCLDVPRGGTRTLSHGSTVLGTPLTPANPEEYAVVVPAGTQLQLVRCQRLQSHWLLEGVTNPQQPPGGELDLVRWPHLPQVAGPLLAALSASAMLHRCKMRGLLEHLHGQRPRLVAAAAASTGSEEAQRAQLVPQTAAEEAELGFLTPELQAQLLAGPHAEQALAHMVAWFRHLMVEADRPEALLAVTHGKAVAEEPDATPLRVPQNTIIAQADVARCLASFWDRAQAEATAGQTSYQAGVHTSSVSPPEEEASGSRAHQGMATRARKKARAVVAAGVVGAIKPAIGRQVDSGLPGLGVVEYRARVRSLAPQYALLAGAEEEELLGKAVLDGGTASASALTAPASLKDAMTGSRRKGAVPAVLLNAVVEMLSAGHQQGAQAREGEELRLPVVTLHPRGSLGRQLADPSVRCWTRYRSLAKEHPAPVLMVSSADLASWAAAMRRQAEDPAALWLSMLAHMAERGVEGVASCTTLCSYSSGGWGP